MGLFVCIARNGGVVQYVAMTLSLDRDVRIGVVRGGTGPEFSLSLDTGREALKAFDPGRSLDILVDKNGKWFVGGVERKPADIRAQVDVIVNALHGGIGEDGTIQKLFSSFGIPATGSGALSSSLSLHKQRAREVFQREALPVPQGCVLVFTENSNEDLAYKIFQTLGVSVIFKPLALGGGAGVHVARSFPEIIRFTAHLEGPYMIEQYIEGLPVSCAVVEAFRGENLYTFLPVEAELRGNLFTDHTRREEMVFSCPSSLPRETKKVVEQIARAAHRGLGLGQYSQSDFIISRSGRVYLLEANSLPSYAPRTPLATALDATGTSPEQFVRHLSALALAPRNY